MAEIGKQPMLKYNVHQPGAAQSEQPIELSKLEQDLPCTMKNILKDLKIRDCMKWISLWCVIVLRYRLKKCEWYLRLNHGLCYHIYSSIIIFIMPPIAQDTIR